MFTNFLNLYSPSVTFLYLLKTSTFSGGTRNVTPGEYGLNSLNVMGKIADDPLKPTMFIGLFATDGFFR